MPYSFNPHRHVKIWLSLDPDFFLSQLNKSRLIQMRNRNPGDEIHFVYDKRLLSTIADEKLQQFCSQYNLTPHDFTADIKPQCTTDEEIKLVEQYEEQFKKIALGIYVGSLSDITRWLGPVYRLGTYSDFDITIDTSSLHATILVERPLLLNLNAVPVIREIQSVDINCDIISVADEYAALGVIKKIQQTIVKNCSICTPTFSPYQEYVNAAFRADDMCNFPRNLSGLTNADRSAMHHLSQNKDLCTLRDFLMEYTENNDVFAEFLRKNASLVGIVATINTEMKHPYWGVLPEEIRWERMTLWRETLRDNYLMNTVIYTTGSGALVLSLFPDLLYSASVMNSEVLPYSYGGNRLAECFTSRNQQRFEGDSGTNDLSWLKNRKTVILERSKEEQMARGAASTPAMPSRGFFATNPSAHVAIPSLLPPEVIEVVSLYNK